VRVGVSHTEINTTLYFYKRLFVRVALTLYFYKRLFGENETGFRANETGFYKNKTAFHFYERKMLCDRTALRSGQKGWYGVRC
jgi:hypothetical protein